MQRILCHTPFKVSSLFWVTLLLTFLGSALSADAEEPLTVLPGVHYDRITPPIVRSGTKPEIVEVFNFKCPHCFKLSPRLSAWLAKNKGRFTYKALPVYWGKQTDTPLRAFFAAEFLGKGEAMKQAIFQAHFGKSADIDNVEEIIFLAESVGLKAGPFRDYLTSFGVSAKMAQAKAWQSTFRTSSTPTLILNGTYRISPGKHASNAQKKVDYARLFKIIETLAAQ